MESIRNYQHELPRWHPIQSTLDTGGKPTMQLQSHTTPELESSVYGSLAHTTEVFIDTVSADAAVARIHGGPPIPGCVYIGSRGLARSPQHRRELRRWPTDPRSPFKQFQEKTRQDTAWQLNASDPANEPACREITRAFAVPHRISGAMCLILDIEDQMRCMIVLVRGGEHQPFHEVDVERAKALAPAAGRVVREGLIRQLQSINPALKDSLRPIATNNLLERLSKTELRILPRLLERETERQIAQTIGRSPHTIHVHVKSIYRKLMVSSRKQLADMLDGQTILDPQPADDPSILAA
jgi:DNA-binding CsgD family transcriptional regulator